MHVPLNDHQGATGPDTSPFEPTASDDEFLERPRTTPTTRGRFKAGSPKPLLGHLLRMHIDAEWLPLQIEREAVR